jgi:general secretion pathway protein A
MDLRASFGFNTTPFTRELRCEDMLCLPFLDEGLARLSKAVDKRMSAAVIAAAGEMKTGLLRRLHAQLPEARYRVRYVKVTDLCKRDMCREIAAACGLDPAGYYGALVRKLQDRFETDYSTDGLRPVLLLDEAHDIRPDVLAMLRVITNFRMDSRLVLSLVLAGQSALRNMLCRDDQEAIARRIVCYVTLRPLTSDETRQYIEHRCAIAGAKACPFDEAAIQAVHEISRGNARTIDNLALEAIEISATAKLKVVSASKVVEAKRSLWP